MKTQFQFLAKTNKNGAWGSGGSHKNATFSIKGFYYQPRNKKQKWVIIILTTASIRLKFAEEDIDIQVTQTRQST